jgi:hypothetical protein
VKLNSREFNQAIGAIKADWNATDSTTMIWAIAEVGPFTLEIQNKAEGSIGMVSVEARVGGGVQLWRSRNELGVPLTEVIGGMREYLRSVSDDLAVVLGGRNG